MFLPTILISIATFPGAIFHQFITFIFCRLAGLTIYDLCYFRLEKPNGYVIYEKPTSSKQYIWIGMGTFLISTIVGILIALPAAVTVLTFSVGTTLDYLLIWLGISVAMHSFPSKEEAKNMWDTLNTPKTSIWFQILATPFVGLIYVGASGLYFWTDLLYGVCVAFYLPNFILSLIA